MAVTHNPAGFTGTVDQVDEARRFATGGGGRFKVSSSSDWTPSASGSVNRTVNVTSGMAVACGVVDVTTATETLTFAANGGGTDRLDVVVATFDWAAGTVSFRVIQGTSVLPTIVSTGTTVDTTKINWLPGLRYDAVIAVIRARPGVTILAPADLYDVRLWGSWGTLNVVSAGFATVLDIEVNSRIRETLGASGRAQYIKQLDGSWLSSYDTWVDGAAVALPKLAAGVATLNISTGQNDVTGTVSIGIGFTTVPRIAVTLADSGNEYFWIASIQNVTTTTFLLRAKWSTGSGGAPTTGGVSFNWIAVGS